MPTLKELWREPFGPLFALALAAGVALAAAFLLVRLAPRLGWVDAPAGSEKARKLQGRPVAAVGGAAILCGLLAGWGWLDLTGRRPDLFVPGRELGQWLAGHLGPGATLWPLGGVLAAFAVGLLDDLAPGGLRPRWKLFGQAASGAILGAPLLVSTAVEPAAALLVVLLLAAGAVVACNAVNTFDNADGAAGGLVAVALLLRAPLLAAPVLAFLPFNLRGGRAVGPGAPRREPEAYLGDSGSHLLGMLVLLTPAAWPALALPLVDLTRLSVVRVREGAAPWVGDRRHLAHRLDAAGLTAPRVVLALLGIAAPSLVLGWLGVVPTALLCAGALKRTRPPAPPDRGRRAASRACSDPRPAR